MELELYQKQAEGICSLIEGGEAYFEELARSLPVLNQGVQAILAYAEDPANSFGINGQFVVQVLKDIMYGVEHKDAVFLLDAIRYGLLEIYRYTAEELQSEGRNE